MLSSKISKRNQSEKFFSINWVRLWNDV